MAQERSKLACDIGKRIASRRNQLGLTQEQAAERADLTQQFFASVEIGAKNIRAESIIKVSKALDVSTDYILTGTVTDKDRARVAQMLDPLNEEQILIVEDILASILKFGGYNATES